MHCGFCLWMFWDWNSGSHEAHYVEQAVLELTASPASPSRVLNMNEFLSNWQTTYPRILWFKSVAPKSKCCQCGSISWSKWQLLDHWSASQMNEIKALKGIFRFLLHRNTVYTPWKMQPSQGNDTCCPGGTDSIPAFAIETLSFCSYKYLVSGILWQLHKQTTGSLTSVSSQSHMVIYILERIQWSWKIQGTRK